MVISSSTSYQSGSVGNVGRLVDYIDQTDDYTTSLHSMLTLGTLGMNNLGFKWYYDPAFSAVKNIGLLSSILPLSVNRIKLDDPYVIGFPFLNFKLMMLKYIKSSTYLQAMTGWPVIRPVFFDFADISEYFNPSFSSFMYGDTFLINLPLTDKTPYGVFCELTYIV